MASCLKCGLAKLRRDKLGRRKCRRCGVMPSAKFLDRGGNRPRCDAVIIEVDEVDYGREQFDEAPAG